MKMTNLVSGATYTMSKKELDALELLIRNYVFKREGFETALEVQGVNDEGNPDGHTSLILLYKIEDGKQWDECTPLVRCDINLINDDEFEVKVAPRDTKLISNEMYQMVPEDYDFGRLITDVIGTVEDRTSVTTMSIVPSVAQKMFQFKLLGKIYTYYRYITDKKDQPIVLSKIEEYQKKGDIKVTEFIKLEKAADFVVAKDKNQQVPVVPFTGKWLVIGEKVTDHSYEIIIDEKDLKDTIGTNPYDSTAKMWELIKKGKILPLYQLSPMMVIKADIIDKSSAIIGKVLAENEVNPAFSPTGLIVA